LSRHTIRLAAAEHVETVAELWVRAAAWLKSIGTDQWQYPVRLAAIREVIEGQNCWLVTDSDDRVVGTVTVAEFGRFDGGWQSSDQPDLALYVHRLVIAEVARRQELGSAILDWASQRAKLQGKNWLRLDAWTSNEALHQYYLDQGFRLVRTIHATGVVSGVLFERDAGITRGRGPELVEA
jgi:GNAT superfamily N-acetyltransferase